MRESSSVASSFRAAETSARRRESFAESFRVRSDVLIGARESAVCRALSLSLSLSGGETLPRKSCELPRRVIGWTLPWK